MGQHLSFVMCAHFLRRFADRLGYDRNFNIYDTDDQKSALKNILKELQIDSKRYPEKNVSGGDFKCKRNAIFRLTSMRKNVCDRLCQNTDRECIF